MTSPISHHTSHTMCNGASSSNSGCHGGGSSAVAHHTSHTMANGASSSNSGATGGGGAISTCDGHCQDHLVESSLTGPATNVYDSTTNTNFNTNINTNINTKLSEPLNLSHTDDAASIDGSSPCSSASSISNGDMDDSSGITTMSNSVNLANFSIIDSTLREGEQFATAYFDTAQKLRIAKALDEFGVDYIEVTSPAASHQSRADCEAICKLGLKAKVLCHIRCNMDDARIAVQTGVDGINMCIGTSAKLMQHSHGKDMAFITAKAKEVIEYVKSNGVEVRFSGEDSFRSNFAEIVKLYSLVDSLGVDRVGIADTVGGATPMEVFDKISTLRQVVSCDIETHFHNDTGCATANAYVALEAGATHIDTTVLGIGERNGITPLGGLMACLMPTDRKFILNKYKLEKLSYLEQLVAEFVSVEIPFNNFVLQKCD
ncbi:HMGL-like-domain-containing protein [Daldinia caldariorum]|uniref:HMGL-like-domain-containing protein n=1 Tax=Daldinia caldariorum TaxID=326644 RepID=UPI002008C817|nr:HMGL-like-domain-containing protein [Daldinia caldariorum]KAI1470303.1 HMGL-like-domain-containing protein [Daldinia caldariorum]